MELEAPGMHRALDSTLRKISQQELAGSRVMISRQGKQEGF